MKRFFVIMLTLIMALSLALAVGCQQKTEEVTAPATEEAPAVGGYGAPATEEAPAAEEAPATEGAHEKEESAGGYK